MKVLGILGSPHADGPSSSLAREVLRVAEEAGHEVETIYLRDKEIGFCHGCVACLKLGHCVIQDDANAIVQTMLSADVIVWATPIYYYGMCGQMKTMLDRANPLYDSDYAFTQVYFLTSAAENEPSTPEGAIKAIQGWVDCFDRCQFVDTIFAGGVTEPGDIQGHPALEKAYEAGKSLT